MMPDLLRLSRRAALLLVMIAALGPFVSAAGAAEAVDLLLVLAADVSRSIDAQKFQLQREGYASAISDPRVLEAIRTGPRGRIAVAYVEWSGVGNQRVVIDWTIIRDATSAEQFGSQLAEAQRSFADRTSISGGIDFAVAQFDHAPFESRRRTIDVSGDGTNNSGRDVTAARDEAVAKGFTINGLAILTERPLAWNTEHTNPPGGLDAYYRNNVIGGAGAFVMVAQDFKAFSRAIVDKLVAEVARAAPARRQPAPRPRLDSPATAHAGIRGTPGAVAGVPIPRAHAVVSFARSARGPL